MRVKPIYPQQVTCWNSSVWSCSCHGEEDTGQLEGPLGKNCLNMRRAICNIPCHIRGRLCTGFLDRNCGCGLLNYKEWITWMLFAFHMDLSPCFGPSFIMYSYFITLRCLSLCIRLTRLPFGLVRWVFAFEIIDFSLNSLLKVFITPQKRGIRSYLQLNRVIR